MRRPVIGEKYGKTEIVSNEKEIYECIIETELNKIIVSIII